MSVEIYFLIGGLCAAYLGYDSVEQGDWPKTVGIVVLCALWPVMLGFGLGLVATILAGYARRLARKGFDPGEGSAAWRHDDDVAFLRAAILLFGVPLAGLIYLGVTQ